MDQSDESWSETVESSWKRPKDMRPMAKLAAGNQLPESKLFSIWKLMEISKKLEKVGTNGQNNSAVIHDKILTTFLQNCLPLCNLK